MTKGGKIDEVVEGGGSDVGYVSNVNCINLWVL